ncbi:MAG: hypothetical protein R6U36_09900 [Candidatus Fermentibacteraceae bacterium]
MALLDRRSRCCRLCVLTTVSVLLMAVAGQAFAQPEEGGGAGAYTDEEGRLILEEITIKGELRTPQAIFMMLKTTPNLSNVLLERSFIEDVVSPIYPGAFAGEPSFGTAQNVHILPWWARYGSVAAFAGLSAYRYGTDDSEQGLIFGIIAGLDLAGNLILDLGGR